jgi:hypothetical protein
LGQSDIAAQHLHHIVEQEAEGSLKHRGLGRTANQPTQGEDLGDLLKDSLNPPAGEVHSEQISGGIARGVQQIGDQDDGVCAGPR